MKKQIERPTLEQLLASVEHAGRDARRQQELSDMIERMAAEEALTRKTVRLWTARLAVAATVTIFVVTSVWKWVNPSQPMAEQVAQAPVVRKTELPLPTREAKREVPAQAKAEREAMPLTGEEYVMPMAEELPVMEEEAVEETLQPFVVQEEWLAEVPVQEESLPVGEEPESAAPIEGTADKEQQPMPAQDGKQASRSFFSFMQAEPSLMDGAVLAFNIL